MANNPITYTARTFQSIMANINSDPDLVDKPDWWKRVWAGIGDVLSVWNNAALNNAYLRTAFSRRAVTDILRLIDYELSPASTSRGVVLFDIDPDVSLPVFVGRSDLIAVERGTGRRFEARSDVTVNAAAVSAAAASWNTGTNVVTVAHDFYTGERVRVQTPGTLPTPIEANTDYWTIRVSATQISLAETRAAAFAGQAINITAAGSGGHEIVRLSRAVEVWQQTSVDTFSPADGDGVTPWIEIPLPDRNIIADSVQITVNAIGWTAVDTFAFSEPTDRHFRVVYLSDGAAIVEFGDGEYGRIPEAFPIEVQYAVGGGTASNVQAVNRVTVYEGDAALIEGCVNPGAITGGGAPEAMETAKRVAPLLLKSRDRFVTAEDGEALAINYGGLSQVRVIANAFGLLTARVVAVALGGGNPTAGLQAEIEAFLEERSVLGSIDVTFNDVTLIAVNVTSAAKPRPGFTWAGIGGWVTLAWRLILTETGREIESAYLEGGITDAITVINGIFSTSYTQADAADITRILDQYARFKPRTIGDTLNESGVIAFVKNAVEGVDYMTIASPAFPLEQAEDAILTVGTLTLTEIV